MFNVGKHEYLKNFSLWPKVIEKALICVKFDQITAMVTVSDIARNKIVELRQKDGLAENTAIRVAVEGGGCSGLMYDLQFDATQQSTDHLVEDKGIKILVDRKSLLYLAGTELDFSDGLNGKGFQFKNPNATRTCGCGESFAV
jgi:iron-sulfur cluster assembly protein